MQFGVMYGAILQLHSGFTFKLTPVALAVSLGQPRQLSNLTPASDHLDAPERGDTKVVHAWLAQNPAPFASSLTMSAFSHGKPGRPKWPWRAVSS